MFWNHIALKFLPAGKNALPLMEQHEKKIFFKD